MVLFRFVLWHFGDDILETICILLLINYDISLAHVHTILQALLKVVSECSAVALNPPKRDAVNESPLKIVLFALAKMCAHPPCRHCIRSSELFPVIAQLRQSPEGTIANYATVIYDKVNGAWNLYLTYGTQVKLNALLCSLVPESEGKARDGCLSILHESVLYIVFVCISYILVSFWSHVLLICWYKNQLNVAFRNQCNCRKITVIVQVCTRMSTSAIH